MIFFVSSTYRDLQAERAAAQDALRQGEAEPWGMEFFNSQPDRPLDVCLREVGQSDAVVLIVGFRGGSLIPGAEGLTYTGAEFQEALKLKRPVFVFVKTEAGTWRNEEPAGPLHDALNRFKRDVLEACGTVSFFENLDELRFEVLASVRKWTMSGRPGARKTFASRDEFFAPYVRSPTDSRLFDFDQTLQGRKTEIETLDSFLANPALRVALVTGRGGIGKTKILNEWTSHMEEFRVSFLRPGGVWHRESDKELPAGNILIIVDDAHRASHIRELIALVQMLAQNRDRSVKLLLSVRPSGLLALRSVLSRFFEPNEICELVPLEKLRIGDVRALASELLGPDYAHLRDWLVGLSADTPLVTVVGARLITTGKLETAAIQNESEFHHAVFDQFIDEYTTVLPNDGFPWRRLIDLLAATSPARARNKEFLSSAAGFLGRREHEINQALDQLETHGLLIRQDDRIRIVPDTLGDYILEAACINSHGEPTGYADAVFNSFRNSELSSLLSNLAELEWRLEQKNAPGRVLQGIWDEIGADFQEADAVGRTDILTALERAATFQPARTIRIVRLAMDTKARSGLVLGIWELSQREVLGKIPALLESIAYHESHTDEAIRRLYTLANFTPPLTGPEQPPGKVLLGIASYGLYKPVTFLMRIADIAVALTHEVETFNGPFTPLDITGQLLEKDIRHTESTEYTFSFGSRELNYAIVAPVRDKALKIAEESLHSSDPRISGRAVKSFSAVLSSFTPIVGRHLTDREREWQDIERIRALDIIEARIGRPDTPLPLVWQIRDILRHRRARHHSEAFLARLREVKNAIPETEDLSIFDAFCTPDHERQIEIDDFSERERRASEELNAAVERFRHSHPTVPDQMRVLQAIAEQADEYRIDTRASAYPLLQLLCRDADFANTFIEYALGDPLASLGFQIRVLLPQLREQNPTYYEQVGSRGAIHPMVEVALGIAHGVCLGPGLGSPIPEDVPIIQKLANHHNIHVRGLAIDGAARLGHTEAFRAQAMSIIAGVDLGGRDDLATALCNAFGVGRIPVAALTHEQVRSVLSQMVSVDRVDDIEHNTFFSALGPYAPGLLFEFFFERLHRYGELQGAARSGYSPWLNTPPRSFISNTRLPADVAGLLRRLPDLLGDDALPISWIAELFWAFGDAEGAAQQVLNEWLNSADDKRICLATYIAESGADGPPMLIEVDAGWTGDLENE